MIPNRMESIRQLLKKLGPVEKLRVCYEAGPTGYVLYWQLAELGVQCEVIAPSLVPVKAGDRVKTDRRDAEKLARSYRSRDLTAVWVPDAGSEALRDLVRAREAAKQDELRARHRLGKFLLRSGHRPPTGVRSWNNNVDDLSDVIRALDKKAQGEFSLRLLMSAHSPEQLRDVAPNVHRVFVDARAQMMEETLGNLSAFYAMFPGNHRFNVFPMWLGEDHHARLSSVFAPHLGHPHSEDLDSEYLNIFETRTRTPFFQDVYVDGVRVMLIIGPTGTGKSVHGNQIIALEQKYGGFTYIFDIGGSYESVVELYGGKVDRVGKDGPRVNPFALEPTESNIKFLYSFVKLLLTNGGAELEPEDDDVIHKAVQDMYLLDAANRRLSNLFLPKKLDRYLSKWVGKGLYNAVFDNVEDMHGAGLSIHFVCLILRPEDLGHKLKAWVAL